MQSERTKRWCQIRAMAASILGAFLVGLAGHPSPHVSPTMSGITPKLIDPAYPPGITDTDWQYRESLDVDLDGDGINEILWVVARASWNGRSFDFDDGQPWQVYVEEADGKRTYLYSRWVQLETLEVGIAQDHGKPSVIILERQSFSFGLYRIRYSAPGVQWAESIGLAQLSNRTTLRPVPETKPGEAGH